MNARSQRRIFFRLWVAIIRQCVISGEWRSLRTRNLAPSRSLTPQRLHPKFGTACFLPSCVVKHQGGRARGASDVVTLVAIARAPPPFLSLRHTSGWTSKRGVRAMIVAHAVARAPPLVTSRERRCAFIVTWDFWDFVKNIIFFNIV